MKNILLAASLFCWFGTTEVRLSAESTLANLSDPVFLELLGKGGTDLFKEHGDQLLELLYFRSKPTEAELEKMTSNPPVLKEKKADLPVWQALRNGGKSTLDLLSDTDFFDYPVHPAELEVIAYLLSDMMGSENSTQFAKEKAPIRDSFRKDNWIQILKMLEDRRLRSGHFIVDRLIPGTSTEIQPTMSDLVQERAQLRKLASVAKDIGAIDLPENYYRFRKILLAIGKFSSENEKPPPFLYDLVAKNYLEPSALTFTDSQQFSYNPRYLANHQKDDGNKEILRIESPDEKLLFKGYMNCQIQVVPVVSRPK